MLGPGSYKETVLFVVFVRAQWKRNLIVRVFS